MFTIPARLYDRFKLWLILPFLIITALSVMPVLRLQFESGFSLLLPDDDPYQQNVEQIAQIYGSSELITVAVDIDTPFTASDIERVREFTEKALEVPGTAYVVSLATMPDLYLEDGALVERPLYDPQGDPDLTTLRQRVLGTPLFREIFVSADGRALLSYVVPEPDAAPVEYAERLVETVGDDDLKYFGDAVVESYVSNAVSRELIILGSLALLIVFLVEVIISRSFLIGLVLALVSGVPAFWTLGLLPLIGQSVETTTMMVPVIVLVLATSYSIHVFRYHSLRDGDMANTLSHVSKVVLSAGLTTIVGFVSLLVTPSAILQRLGFLIICGIAFALATSLLLFPPILARLRIPEPKAKRRPRRSGAVPEEAQYQASMLSGMTILHREPRRPVVRLVIFGVALLPFVIAIPFIRGGYSSRDAFRPGSRVEETVRYFEERSEATQQVEMSLDTGTEYGLVPVDSYRQIKALTSELEQDPAIRRVLDYTDFVEWMLSRLEGEIMPVAPESDADIGEAMELLSGEGAGQIFEALVDTGWERTRFLIQINLPRIGSPRSIEAVESLLDRVGEVAGSKSAVQDFFLVGEPLANLHHITYLSRSQFISILVFMPILAVFLTLVFRSLRWALVTLIPTLVGVVVYFGTVSLAGFLHDPIHVFMVAALMGVSNDDVLYFIIVFRDQIRQHSFAEALATTVHRTGIAIIQTTLIIVAGISAFYFSNFVLLGRAALVATVSLVAASLTTLLVVPAVLKLNRKMQRRLAGSDATAAEAELK